MSEKKEANPYAGHGGSYIRHADGKVTVNEAPTVDHPEGNAPRDKDGRRFDIKAEDKPKEKPAS